MRLCSTGAAAAFLCPTLALRLGETAILAVLGGCKTQLAAAEKMLMVNAKDIMGKFVLEVFPHSELLGAIENAKYIVVPFLKTK